jgi:lipopolysaccharide export system permease protein
VKLPFALPRIRILDRYIIAELIDPSLFGLSAFTMILVATNLLAISKLVANEHAPVWAVMQYFFWQLPSIVVLVIPMAMLLGVLLSLQRLSGESEITAMKAGGISLIRIVKPLLSVGLAVSIVALFLQEGVVPFANDRATDIRRHVIQHISPFSGGTLTVNAPLPGGARQLTTATSYEASTQTMHGVTVVQFDRLGLPRVFIFSKKARFNPPSWIFTDATWYYFYPDGSTAMKKAPIDRVDIGETPGELTQHKAGDNPEEMSRAQIRDVLTGGQLTPVKMREYQLTYEEKLARPFACFVFTLLAIPFGLRPTRGGGRGLGFGLAVLIIFIYFVVASVVSAIFSTFSGGLTATVGAWLPNVLFTLIGVGLLRRAARH